MNFIQWLKMDYARSKKNWFEFRVLCEKTPTERGFKIWYAAFIPITIWVAPFCYLWERKLSTNFKEFRIDED